MTDQPQPRYANAGTYPTALTVATLKEVHQMMMAYTPAIPKLIDYQVTASFIQGHHNPQPTTPRPTPTGNRATRRKAGRK